MTAPDLLHGMLGEFQLVRCSDCRHIYLNPRPKRSVIQNYYPQDYGPFRSSDSQGNSEIAAQQALGQYRSRRFPHLRRIVHSLVESQAEWLPPIDRTPRHALELGCAGGRFLQTLQSEGWIATGIEPVASAAHQAQQHGLTVHNGTIESAALPESEFDAAFAWMVLEHLHDPLSVLNELHRVLKSDGWLVLSVPNMSCWEPWMFRKYWYALQLPTHLQHFTAHSIRFALERSGFGVERIIQQRNTNNLVGSVGLWLRQRRITHGLGERLIRWTDNPTGAGLLALMPLARMLAFLKQAGRLTVIARRRDPS
jgi:2-polyprenyl-3-methyl-5-hydroxy-6-metoxy-1,4-benzoquinol methylase